MVQNVSVQISQQQQGCAALYNKKLATRKIAQAVAPGNETRVHARRRDFNNSRCFNESRSSIPGGTVQQGVCNEKLARKIALLGAQGNAQKKTPVQVDEDRLNSFEIVLLETSDNEKGLQDCTTKSFACQNAPLFCTLPRLAEVAQGAPRFVSLLCSECVVTLL
jgi:hypothetical protein